MFDRIRRIFLRILKTLGAIISDVLAIAIRVVGTVLLVVVMTGMIFACIFVLYVKNNVLTDQDLHVDLEEFQLNQTSVVQYQDPDSGKYYNLTNLQSLEDRTWISYEDIPLDLQHAVAAIEDKRFYAHEGVDWFRTILAFFNMFLSDSDTFGGSTLTQQLIKNTTHRDEVTVQRKFMEIFEALDLEKRYSKEDIMEWYLNVVYFGSKKYGISAASQYYFGKNVKDLTLAEMASIVGITNNPSMYSPYLDEEANKERQENILNQMYLQGYISYDKYIAAVNQPLVFTSESSDDDNADSDVYSWFVDALIEDVIDALMEIKGCDYETAELLLTTGGYQIRSTINPEIQSIVDSVYGDLDNIPETYGTSDQLQSAIVITDPYTGNIVALSGGVGEKVGNRVWNRATDTTRSPGSSIKPIAVYAPAMDLGLITPDTKIEDSKYVKLKGTSWMTVNYDHGYSGVVTLRQAVIDSLNVVSAQVIDWLTPQVSYDFLSSKLGIKSLVVDADGDSDIDYAPLCLGALTYGLTVREIATAYNIFPNQGIWTESRLFTEILDSDGNVIYENIPETHAAISDTTAYWMTDILQDVMVYGTGDEAMLRNMPSAGKTGTTSDWHDRWFVGFTPYYVAAVWTGYDSPAYISVSGNPAANLWKQVMSKVHEDLEYRKFPVPENTYLAPVPGVTEVEFTVRGVDKLTGKVLYTTTEPGVEEREIEVEAQSVPDYKLLGESTIKHTLQRSNNDNIITFYYESTIPVVTPAPTSPGTSSGGIFSWFGGG